MAVKSKYKSKIWWAGVVTAVLGGISFVVPYAQDTLTRVLEWLQDSTAEKGLPIFVTLYGGIIAVWRRWFTTTTLVKNEKEVE